MSASPGRALLLVENLSVPFDRRVWQEARALRGHGWDVEVVCPCGPGHDTEPDVVLEGIRVRRYPLRTAAGGPFGVLGGYVREYAAALWHTLRLARRVLADGPVDVVHLCNPPDLLFLPALWLRRHGARIVFDHHDLSPELYLSRFGAGRDAVYWVLRACERLTFAAADVVLSTNESYRAVAVSRGRRSPEEVFVVRSAPDVARFWPVPPDPDLSRGAPHLLCYLGVMGPQDGVDEAVRALAHLAALRDDWHAVLVGDGDARSDAETLAAGLGIAERLTFTGRVPDDVLRAALSSATVCLAPDPSNPLNDASTMNKILEYMAMGRPTVCFDLPEARVSAGDAARYARPGSAAHFAALVDQLLDDPDQRATMGVVGQERIAGELSWSVSEKALLAAYAAAGDR